MPQSKSFLSFFANSFRSSSACLPYLFKKALTEKQNLCSMAVMRTKTIAVTLGFLLASVWALQAAENPNMGTWKLNESKSKLSPGTGKNNTVTYSNTMMGKVKVTVDGIDGKGKPAHNAWTGKFDGKDYPVTGDPNSDSRSYRKVND